MRLTIERMAHGADAVAHDATGKVVFVANATPGDIVDAEVVSTGGAFDRARIISVIEPGPDRVTPICPHATRCGGCPWAQLSRPAQRSAKHDAVVDALVRIGRLGRDVASELVGTCENVGDDLHYRNKIELGATRMGGRVTIGMHAPGGKELVRVDACPLFDAPDPKLVRGVAGALSYLAGSGSFDPIRVALRSSSRTGSLEVALWTAPGPLPRAQVARVIGDATQGRATSVVRVLAKGPAGARRVVGVERLAGAGHWGERVAGGRMRLSAPSFFQVNTRGAERLIELAVGDLSPTGSDEAVDLYCGAGTFTLPLARRVGWVHAVEASGPAVRDLRRNLDAASIVNVNVTGGDAGREFPDSDADVIVVDPPRAGLGKDVIARLSAQGARAIAYVSCEPTTLARDLARFQEHGTFRPLHITPVDLFPHTYHVETVTLLAPA